MRLPYPAEPDGGERDHAATPASRPAGPREVEAFDPVPPWVKATGLVAIGLVIGFVIGRLL